MKDQVITDRAEALFLASDERGEEPYRPVPITRRAASADDSAERMACPWCGSFSVTGPGCDSCGSPLY